MVSDKRCLIVKKLRGSSQLNCRTLFALEYNSFDIMDEVFGIIPAYLQGHN